MAASTAAPAVSLPEAPTLNALLAKDKSDEVAAATFREGHLAQVCTALVAIAMAAHYLPISPSNAAYVKTPPPPRERAPRDAFATLVEPEESEVRRRGVIQRGRLKVRCDGSVGSVWVFVALSRGTRASEPAVGAHGADGTRADEDAVIQFLVLAAASLFWRDCPP